MPAMLIQKERCLGACHSTAVRHGERQFRHVIPRSACGRDVRVAVQAKLVNERKESAAGKVTSPSRQPSTPPPVPNGNPSPTPEPPAGPKTRKKPTFAAKVFDKTLDTLEDVGRHVRRAVLPPPTKLAARDKFIEEGNSGLRLQSKKPVVLVLGSGWAAHSLIKVIDTDNFDVVLVSPRNYFIFTPMLPSTAVGTVEFRSLLEPIRVANPFVNYLEASCDVLDVKRKVALCTSSVAFENGRKPQFEVPYDVLVVSVGEQPATFGVPGVSEHCYFMKEIEDCVGLRKRIGECFELASLPGTTEQDRRKALHFVVVGGGPTGVEFAGTLSDFVRLDLKQKYPELMPYVRVSLLQSGQAILTQFDKNLASQAIENLKNVGVDVRTGVRVVAVTQDQLVLAGGEQVDYGVCVWSAGNASRSLVESIVAQLPEQRGLGCRPGACKLAVDDFMRVVGAQDMLALGDCSLMEEKLPPTAQVAGQQGSYAAHLINRGYSIGLGGRDRPPPCKPSPDLPEFVTAMFTLFGGKVDYKETMGLDLDTDERAAATTLLYYNKPFEFLSLGLLAYIGNDKALTQLEAGSIGLNLYGSLAFLLWKSVYITKQVSFRNRLLILFDWMKCRVFGRDLSQF